MSYNPFSGWRITGDWADHMSYSLGGTDYPLPYGTQLPAPAAGTLRTSGGSGERRAGEVGSAGRRSILDLDTPLGDMVSIVFQHQSRFGQAKHYEERETLGWSGASANGDDWGGDAHLHIHGLDKHGNRVDYTTHITSSTPSGGGATPITSGDDDMATLELVQTASGKEGIFYSVNRLQRYAVDGPTTLADYQFFITEHRKAGNVNAKPDVQIVKNLSAFGAIVR